MGVEEVRKSTKTRWIESKPTDSLHWFRPSNAKEFVRILEREFSFTENSRLVEIGPGYGRVLNALTAAKVPFQSFFGIDLSEENVKHLRKKFEARSDMDFVCGDAEEDGLGSGVDLIFSSLVFQHQFPNFLRMAKNAATSLREGGSLVFDIPEGHDRWFKHNGAFIHQYCRLEIELLLAEAGFDDVRYSYFRHHGETETPERKNFVIARKV